MKTAAVIGRRSDIAKDLMARLVADGWHVEGYARGDNLPTCPWDLCLIAIGRVHPVGWWWTNDELDWEECVVANMLEPVRLLRYIWRERKPGAYVAFMAGSNPQKIMDGYSAYNASKMGLLKVVEQIDHESPDTTIFALGPGYVPTKIHKATLDAKWPNERIARGDSGMPLEKVYDCLKWCLVQQKAVVGGRDICASDPYGPELARKLAASPSMYKLRRME